MRLVRNEKDERAGPRGGTIRREVCLFVPRGRGTSSGARWSLGGARQSLPRPPVDRLARPDRRSDAAAISRRAADGRGARLSACVRDAPAGLLWRADRRQCEWRRGSAIVVADWRFLPRRPCKAREPCGNSPSPMMRCAQVLHEHGPRMERAVSHPRPRSVVPPGRPRRAHPSRALLTAVPQRLRSPARHSFAPSGPNQASFVYADKCR